MTSLYLMRHGQAVCNVPPFGAVAGMKGDAGLTALGRLQAERLRDRLTATGEIGADVLISSTLPRARQTAEILAPAFGLPILFDDEVQEMRVGELDGQPWEEAKSWFPDFRIEPYRPVGPSGENWGQFVLRIGTALDRIVREHPDKTIVVVCHGGVIDAAFLVFLGMHTLRPPDAAFYTHNTSITLWERKSHDGQTRWRLVKYNDDLHARDIGTQGHMPQAKRPWGSMPERIHWTRLAPSTILEDEEPAAPLPTEEAPC